MHRSDTVNTLASSLTAPRSGGSRYGCVRAATVRARAQRAARSHGVGGTRMLHGARIECDADSLLTNRHSSARVRAPPGRRRRLPSPVPRPSLEEAPRTPTPMARARGRAHPYLHPFLAPCRPGRRITPKTT